MGREDRFRIRAGLPAVSAQLVGATVSGSCNPGPGDAMRYLCLIYLDEKELAAMPEGQVNTLNARHLEFNDGLLASGQFIEAEALETGSATTCLRVRQGKSAFTDGPYAETKEQ